MTQPNPFADFQDDPFFNFGTSFGTLIEPTANLGVGGDILDLEPDVAFQGALQRSNPTPNLLRQFQNQRESLFSQFEGIQEQLIRQGQIPGVRFGDFLQNFSFERESFRAPPSDRPGGGTSQFAPRTQFFR